MSLSGLSPETASLIGDAAVLTAQAFAAGLKAKNDADARRATRDALLEAAAMFEDVEAHKQFPNLRED